jgi:hypothetical protein
MISPVSTSYRAFADLDDNSLIDSVFACFVNLPGRRGEPDGHTDIILLEENESVEIILVKHNPEAFLIRDPNHWIQRRRVRR